MKISFALIVKNESVTLHKCLDSLKGADEIVICDTGSEDNTVEIAKKYTDKVFTDYKWNDNFSEARNHANSKCTGDWIFIIDADCKLVSTVEEVKEVATLAEKEGEKAVPVKCRPEKGGLTHYLPLLYKNDKEVFWKGPVHNHLSYREGKRSNLEIAYWHSSSHSKDPDRSLRILKKVVSENPECIREKFYLAREYFYREDYITALYWYNEYMKKADWGAEMADAYLFMAKCYWYLQKGDFARAHCMQSILLNANFKEAILFLAEMSGPKNKERWLHFADSANNDMVLFLREPVERDSEYYNNVYLEKPSMARYEAIQKEIGKMVGDKTVLDVGCGTAELSKYVKNYKGFDFSKEAIKASNNEHCWVGSAYDKPNFKNADYFVITEVLEHVNDLKVIENIPKGQKVIFTVPSFTDPAHLRVYTEKIVRERYKDLFEIKNIIRFNWYDTWVKDGGETASYILLIDAIKK